MSAADDGAVAVGEDLALLDEGVDHSRARRSTTLALGQLTATGEGLVGSILAVVLGLGIGALMATDDLGHGREAAGRALGPAFVTGDLPPVVDALKAGGALGHVGGPGG